jgi:hypothetical protein
MRRSLGSDATVIGIPCSDWTRVRLVASTSAGVEMPVGPITTEGE